MDRISGLSDELLLKILCLVPTRVAISTSLLSKRWEFLWMWLPKLKFCYASDSDSKLLLCFLENKLPLHRAPVIESFHLRVPRMHFKPEDIKMCVVLALSRNPRELEIDNHFSDIQDVLPSNLYTSKSLVILKLSGDIRLDIPRMVGLPSLKTLHLIKNEYLDGKAIQRLLSICPVLEELLVDCRCDCSDNLGWIIITIPSLRSLMFYMPGRSFDGFVINTPCLTYLKIENFNGSYNPCLFESYMPNLKEAYLAVRFPDIKSVIGEITSVKRLTICLEEVVYSGGFVFNQLEHLTLCVCGTRDSNLLVQLLEDSPNLRVLDIVWMDHGHMRSGWGIVSKNIMSYLEKLLGRPQKRDLEVKIFGKPFLLEDCNSNT